MRILLMGPPGSGKGTQAAWLARVLRIPAISTGDIFRANVEAGTPLGRETRMFLDAGEYVPDSITSKMVRDRLQDDDAAHGWLLDGYPRTIVQAQQLDDIAASAGHSLEVVVALEVDEEELVRRLAQRAVEEGRADDTEEVIRRRQALYREQTAPLLAAYRERSLLQIVDGDGSVDDVAQRILAALRQGPFTLGT